MPTPTIVAAVALAAAVLVWVPASPWGRLGVAPGERGASVRPRWSWPRASTPDPAVEAHEVSRACVLLAVCLDAGRPARGALRIVAGALDGPAREPLARVLAQIDLGIDEADAWASLADRAAYRGMARDLSRAVHSGVALADLLRRHAADARRQSLVAAEVRARAVGVTGVLPLVLCFLPSFVLLGVVPVFGGLVGRLFG